MPTLRQASSQSAGSDTEFIAGERFDDGTHNQSYLRAWVMQRAALDSGTVQVNPDLDRLMSNLPVESALLQGRSEALRVRVLLGAASLALRAQDA